MADVFLRAADLSHDGVHVAFATLTVGDEDDHEQLWIAEVNAPHGEPTEVMLPGAPGALAWSPREDVLAIAVSVDEVSQIYIVRLDGSQRQVTHAHRGVAGDLAWSSDGTELAIAVLHDEPSKVTRAITAMDGLGPLAEQDTDIHVVDVGSGAGIPLTSGPSMDRDPVFDVTGTTVSFVRSYEPSAIRPIERPLEVDRNGVVRELSWSASSTSTVLSLEDGRTLLVSSRQADRPRGVPPSLYVRHPDGTVEDRSDGLDLHLLLSTLGDQPSVIEDPRRFVGVHGDDAVVGISRGGSAEVVRIALSGAISAETVLAGERGCHPLALRGDRLLFAESTMHRPPTLRLLDLESGAESTVVDPNPELDEPPFEIISLDVVSHDDPIDAWFLRPASLPGGPLPTILIIHGGPYEAFGQTYYGDAHLLTEAGYGVLMANPHGSIGYGQSFATSIFGQPSHQELDDLLAVVDHAVELGLADPNRLAVCGLSYGGYISAHLVGRSDRFRAGVIENPVIDLKSFWATSDIGADFLEEMLQGGPDEVPERYTECSPLHYADRCRTPSLLILGDDDLRCPPSQGEQFHEALNAAGCITDLVRLPGAAHADSARGTPEVRSKQDRALLDWMQRYNPS